MKGFQKGYDPRRNKKGRPKGSPNKSTDEVRASLQVFIEANIEKLQSDFDQLEPKDRLAFLERMLKHILPPPLNDLEKLTDEELDEVINRLKTQDSTPKM